MLKRIGVSIDGEQKNLIVAGDTEALMHALVRVGKHFARLLKSKREKGGRNIPGADAGGGAGARGRRKTRAAGAGDDDDQDEGYGNGDEEEGNAGNGDGAATLGGSAPSGPTNIRISPALLAKMEASMSSEDASFEETLRDAPTVAAFIVLSLSKALNLRPRQVTALVTTNTRYLIHVLAKGLKGRSLGGAGGGRREKEKDRERKRQRQRERERERESNHSPPPNKIGSFKPVVLWLLLVCKNISTVVRLLEQAAEKGQEKGDNAMSCLMETLRPALLSLVPTVAKGACKVLSTLSAKLSGDKLRHSAWKWLTTTSVANADSGDEHGPTGLQHVVICARRVSWR